MKKHRITKTIQEINAKIQSGDVVYLLCLAHKQGGRLATFDRCIPFTAVKGAAAGTLEVIAPVE